MSIGAGLEDGRAVKDAYMKELVRKAYYREQKSKREIARELGIHRNTVSRLLKLEPSEIPKLQRKDWHSPVVGPYMAVIQAWLEMDALAPRKQQHTAKRIYDRLVEEYQFQGSYRRIREVVAELRQKPKEVFLPLVFEPGEMAQADWIEDMRVVIAGQLCKVQVLNLVLNHSGSVYCEAFHNAQQEAFFQGQANAFAFWRGIPRTVTFDNLKSAVQKILTGKNRLENERFSAFRGAYLFDSRFCNLARGNEKGRVENMVKFVERNFFTPVPCVESLAELNTMLRQRCLSYLQHTQSRQTQTVGERLQVEQGQLLPLPTHLPECCRIIPVKASKAALVQFETNRYSVPSEYAYQTLWLKSFVDHIEITNQQKVIAVHVRLQGKCQESIRFEHYRKVLSRKPGAERHLRATDKQPLSPRKKKSEQSPYPQVTVQAPDLSKYSQLLRSLHYDSATGTFTGNPSKKAAPSQYSQAIP